MNKIKYLYVVVISVICLVSLPDYSIAGKRKSSNKSFKTVEKHLDVVNRKIDEVSKVFEYIKFRGSFLKTEFYEKESKWKISSRKHTLYIEKDMPEKYVRNIKGLKLYGTKKREDSFGIDILIDVRKYCDNSEIESQFDSAEINKKWYKKFYKECIDKNYSIKKKFLEKLNYIVKGKKISRFAKMKLYKYEELEVKIPIMRFLVGSKNIHKLDKRFFYEYTKKFSDIINKTRELGVIGRVSSDLWSGEHYLEDAKSDNKKYKGKMKVSKNGTHGEWLMPVNDASYDMRKKFEELEDEINTLIHYMKEYIEKLAIENINYGRKRNTKKVILNDSPF
jgi:hypothetical protein